MIDILVYLFENYQDFAAHPAAETLAARLNEVGFEKAEISDALDWLAGLKQSADGSFGQEDDFNCDARSLRVFADSEKRRLGTDCLDFLLFLEAAGVVTPFVRELILERSLALAGDALSLARFKIIVLMVLWSREHELEPLLVEELLCDREGALPH